jgi:hypothetical protein
VKTGQEGVALRRFLTIGFIAAAGLLMIAAAAYACAPQAKMKLNKGAAVPGEMVDGSGTGFNGTPAAGEVEVHFNSTEGNVVWTGRPSPTGALSFSFEVPEDVEPGYYTIVATQYEATGRRVPGTPARASLQVLATETAKPPAPAPPAKKEARDPAASRQPETATRPAAAVAAPPATTASRSDVPAPTGRGVSESRSEVPTTSRAPQVSQAPAPAGERRAVVGPGIQSSESGVPVMLALGLVVTGLALSVVASASVMAGRRSKKAAVAGTDSTRKP